MIITFSNFIYLLFRTRLILPVVKAGVTEERMSFHSCPVINVIHLRITFVLIPKDYEKKMNFKKCLIIIVDLAYSAIDKVVEIFDVHGLDHVDICDPKIRYHTVKTCENFSVFLH
jgi:hypothetical protein